MLALLVYIETFLCCSFILTLVAGISYSLMFIFLMSFDIWVVCGCIFTLSHKYVSPSCMAWLCLLSSTWYVDPNSHLHLSRENVIPWCFDCWWSFKLVVTLNTKIFKTFVFCFLVCLNWIWMFSLKRTLITGISITSMFRFLVEFEIIWSCSLIFALVA